MGLGTLVLTALLGVAAAIAIVVLVGKPITAPAWVQSRIESRVARELTGVQLSFGSMVFVVNEGWRPRARLTDVRLATPDGQEIVSFSEAEASLAMRPLLKGQVMPKTVEMTGVFATLRRDEDGRVTLSGGADLGGPAQQAATLPQLIKQLDTMLLQPQFAALRTADIYALTLRYEDVRSSRAWTVDGGRLRLNRDGRDLTLSADLALLSGGTGVATLEANYASQIGSPVAEFGAKLDDVSAGDIAAQGPAFAWLDALRAPISGAVRSGVGSDGVLSPLSATLQIGAGVLQPNDQTRPIPFQSARTYFTYQPASGALTFDEVSVQSQWVTGRAEGQAVIGGAGAGQIDTLVGQFSASALAFNPLDLYAEPVVLDGADMDFRLDMDPFRFTLGQMLVNDQGQTLLAKGELLAETEGWRFALDAAMDSLAPDRLMTLWPDNLVPNARGWVDDNLSGGQLQAIDLSMRGAPKEKLQTYLSFDFADTAIRFMRTMPPITGASGHASLLDNRFVVSVDDGHVTAPEGGRIGIDGSSFIIPDVSVKDGPPAVVRLQTTGTVTAALSMLNQPKLEVMDKAGLDVDLADGRAVLSGTLSLPLKKGLQTSEVEYSASGTLRDVRSDVLVPGRTLAASTLRIEATQEGVRITGQGRLGNVPFDAAWSQPIGVEARGGSRIEGTVEISERTLDEFKITMPPGSVSGQGVGNVTIDLPNGAAPQMQLSSNLRGVRLRLAPLGWSKAAGTAGRLSVNATLGHHPEITALSLDAPGLSAAGNVTLTDAGGLAQATFSSVKVGDWLNAPVDLVGRGAGAAPEIRVRGGRIDLRTANFGGDDSGGSGAQSGPLVLALDRLQITDTIALTGLQGTFSTASGLDGSFTGKINNGAAVNGRVIPQNGRSAVRITSANAGGVFASAGIIKQARGGDLSLTLLPVGQNGAFDGTLKVASTRIKDAPAIADLLSAISIVGLLEQLSGEGILLSEVDANFRLTPDRMILSRASAVGPSIGISMDGTYAVNSGVLDMQGVVSPVYLLNGIGAIFTRKGEGLIGFNYRLRGPAQKPSVSVNPLSALTPGLFREIFRAPPPDIPQEQGQDPAAPEVVPQALRPETPTVEDSSAPPKVDSAQGGR